MMSLIYKFGIPVTVVSLLFLLCWFLGEYLNAFSISDMATIVPSVEDLVIQANDLYMKEFSESPDIAACAPGRVNLIGEHTDYNEGFVLPIALPMVTVVVGSFNVSEKCTIVTATEDDERMTKVVFELKNPVPGKPMWANYVKGVVKHFPGTVPGFNAAFVTSVPVGGGLSSSAALEVATYTFLEALTGNYTTKLTDKALLCQKAEHEYARVPCGIMDQFASIFGAHGKALLIDCRSLDYKPVPLDDPKLVVFIINSNIRHHLSSSEYPIRRRQCNEAASVLHKTSLRDATLEELMASETEMDAVIFRRARHVISEISRTERAVEALEKHDYALFGKLMAESHQSLRDDYEVSCAEVDQLVELALDFGKQRENSVLGSRMTGAGFGGCSVTLVYREALDDLIKYIQDNYKVKTPTFYVASPSYGARILRTSYGVGYQQ